MNNEPELISVCQFEDDRGFSCMNMMQDNLNGGQINFSTMHPGTVKAWHKHSKQVDYWSVVRGALKCAIYNPELNKLWTYVVSERNTKIIRIPNNCWHGCSVVGNECASLLYYVTEKYDQTNPDEERVGFLEHRNWHGCEGFSWSVENK